jgi:GNAT superfamily N-acetyltransferase
MIRHAVEADRPDMVRMGRDFVRASGLPLPFDAAWADHSLAGHMAQPDRLAMVLELNGAPRGMLCAAQVQSPLAPVRVASELVFWIDPPARGRWALQMIRAYEAWAKEQGCALVSLATVGAKGADALYRRCGFAPAERHFMKVL